MRDKPKIENSDWKMFKGGDRQAFAQIYQLHFSALYNYGYRFSGSASLTKDAIQQLFVKLWNHRENLGLPISVRHYLIKSLRRILSDEQKKQNRYQDIPINYRPSSENSQEFLLIKEDAVEQQNEFLMEAMQMLTKRQREAIYLKFFENLSYDEISSAMSLTVKSVYNLICKAIEILRQNTPYVNLMILMTLISY